MIYVVKGKGFQHTKACHIQIMYAKVVSAQIYIGNDPKAIWELFVKVVEILKYNMYLLCNISRCWFLGGFLGLTPSTISG